VRRRQFSQLIQDLRAELSQSIEPAVGVANLPTLKRVLTRNYETLYDDYDWPHLTKVFDRITLNVGERYYDFPDDCDYDKLHKIVVWWNGQPVPIERGIGFEEYATYDSENDDRSDPVCRWDVRATDTVEQMEVWPVPASTGQAIQMVGKLKFEQLVNDEDICRIDDHLVVLASAIELLPEKSRSALQAKLAAAQQRAHKTKSRSKAESGSVRLGLGGSNRPIYGKSVVRVSG
jgi:hypothetical protein